MYFIVFLSCSAPAGGLPRTIAGGAEAPEACLGRGLALLLGLLRGVGGSGHLRAVGLIWGDGEAVPTPTSTGPAAGRDRGPRSLPR